MDGYCVSMETEMARRKLTGDEQELWNFLAAQLHLHSGYLIQRLSRIENVINSVIEYKSVLLKDVDLYQAQLEAERSVTVTPLLRILYHIESNLTILFENLLYELNRTRNNSRTLTSQLLSQTKEKIKFRHITLRFNSDPPSWWWGQFKTWAMRLNDEVARAVDEHILRHNVTGTVVGLHIRRTDKTSEAVYHTLEEYMVHATEWYDTYELTHLNVQRKIYLATDEPEIIRQATSRYPNYEFIYDRNIISSAAPKSRYNEKSLLGTLKDIYSLVRCDYVVCTFSSTMCRLVYELSQAQYGDTHRFRSIDFTYFVPGQGNEYMPVIYDHNATHPSEIDVQTGDVALFYEKHWDGYTKVKDVNKTKTGLIPSFKIDKIFKAYNYSSNVKT